MGKRSLDGLDTTTSKHAKHAKLGEEVLPEAPRGVNLIEDGAKTCTHEVAWPDGKHDERSTQVPGRRAGPPAKEYAFKLDPFQQTAINCLEAGHSVLVAAHTSAGKTLVAEYAFAMALRDNQRVIYTSPLKALSNQKYREFYEEFTDVGLMTGDVTINPDASCLVMTTEILRSMLYKGSSTVREAALVVYDEIHYLRDKERGVVWEESIVLMPKSVRFAFLSATIPNAREFAQWIAKTHKSPCHVVYTDFRPTPLQHYVFPRGGDGLYMVVDEKNVFRDDNFQKAVAALTEAAEAKSAKRGKGKKGGGKADGEEEQSDIYKIVRMIMERQYDPVIIFSFSKKECEELALQMSQLDVNTDKEKKLVEGIFLNAVDILSEEDKKLSQISALLPMLKRGIGIHHSGLLPILKEVIEILFQEGLLKALFATETFSTGLNMPAKTVVFTNARKFDGGGFRWVSSGEYIQMSGRAGRRGKDDRGIVILMLDSKMEPAIAKEMLRGAPDTLHSEFKLGYNMLLNLLRVEGGEPESLLRASYRQFQVERSLPALQQRITALQAERDAVVIEDEEAVEDYLDTMEHAAAMRAQIRSILHTPRHALPFLQPGRLVKLLRNVPDLAAGASSQSDEVCASESGQPMWRSEETAWGAVVSFERQGAKPEEGEEASTSARGKGTYLVDVLVNTVPSTLPGQGPSKQFRLADVNEAGRAQVVVVTLQHLVALSSVRIYIHKDLRPQENCTLGIKAIEEVQKRFPGGIPLLHPEDDLSIKDSALRKAQTRLETFEGKLEKHKVAGAADLFERLRTLQQKRALKAQVRQAKREAKAAGSMILEDELKARRRILYRLRHVDEENDVLTKRGRVAAEIQSADELVLTELMIEGHFKEWSGEQTVAAISCLVWQEKSDAAKKLREDLQGPYATIQQAARMIAKTAAACKMEMDVEEYVARFRPELMEAAAAWYRGDRFLDVQRMTDFFEGSLVRAIRRIEEVLRQLSTAAKAIGDEDLVTKLDDISERIKRDIIFAASLYL